MLNIDTHANQDGRYRFKQDGATGFIFKGAKNGVPSSTGSAWYVTIDGVGNLGSFATKAEAENAADRSTRAGYSSYGEDALTYDALGLSYRAEYEGEATLQIRSAKGDLVHVHLNARQRARLLSMLATDFSDDVLYGNVTFTNTEENDR